MNTRVRALASALLVTAFAVACQDRTTTTGPEAPTPAFGHKPGHNPGGGDGGGPDSITVAMTGGMVAAAQPGVIADETSRKITFSAGDFTPCRESGTGCFVVELRLPDLVDVGSCVGPGIAAITDLLSGPYLVEAFHLGVEINTRTNPSDRGNQMKLFWDDVGQARRIDLLVTTDKQVFPNNKLTVTSAGDVYTFTNGSVWFPGGGAGSVTCPFAGTGSLTVTIDRTP